MSQSRPPSLPGPAVVASERFSWRARALLGVGVALVLSGGSTWLSQLGSPLDRPSLQAFTTGTTEPPPDGGTAAAADPGPTEDDVVAGIETASPPVAALITPSGVIVPAFGRIGDTYLIHTPCGEVGDITGGVPLYGADVVLDPGHGGDIETGSQGANGLVEKDINLQVAEAAERLLTDRGIVTVLARTGDYRVPLAVRAEIGNRLDARLMISIHHNAPSPGPSPVPGTEVYIQVESEDSARLGRLVWEEVVDALGRFEGVSWVAAGDAGVLPVLNDEGDDTYGMVRRPRMPAVLAELGYLANPSEAELFATDAYVLAAGRALADAAERFLFTQDRGEAPMPEARYFTPDGRTGTSQGCIDPDLD